MYVIDLERFVWHKIFCFFKPDSVLHYMGIEYH